MLHHVLTHLLTSTCTQIPVREKTAPDAHSSVSWRRRFTVRDAVCVYVCERETENERERERGREPDDTLGFWQALGMVNRQRTWIMLCFLHKNTLEKESYIYFL